MAMVVAVVVVLGAVVATAVFASCPVLSYGGTIFVAKPLRPDILAFCPR